MTSDSSAASGRMVLSVACDAVALGTLAYLIVSRVFYEDFGVAQEFGADRFLLILIALLLIALRRLSSRLDPRATLAIFGVLAASALPLAVFPLLNVHLESRIRSLLVPVKSALFHTIHQTYAPQATHRLDDRYGFVQVPNSRDSERGRGFTVTYSIDAEGYRTVPSPARPRATVMFLGDSFTYGWGVNDEETFPHVLATTHWPDVRVINAGVEGWGLTQFFLALTDILARPPFPTAIVVAMIEDDLRRSHLRPPVIPGQLRRLEWIDDRFISRDLQRAPAFVADTPELAARETQLAIATVTAMAEAARLKEVPLAAVLLDGGTPFPPDFAYALGRAGVPTLDLTALGQTTLPYDVHPDASGYRKIAGAIAASQLKSLVYGSAADRNNRDE